MASADTGSQGGRRPRPLSPHLSIYRPIVTMVMSIMHRMTGIMNIGGLLIVVAYLLALAAGPEAYERAGEWYGWWPVRVVLVAFTWSVIHHMLGGIRHAVWDVGRGFGEERYTLSWATITGSILITTALWAFIVVWEII
jgi:succinate dehydrogenase / fumarate reductase cytochrome b subunit